MEMPYVLPLILLALSGLLFAASKLSRAGRIAPGLRPMVGKAVAIRVWGTPIDGVRVHSVGALGAGLLLLLEPAGGGKPTLLKVAQPQSARHDERSLVIDDARYMQWAGKRLPRAGGLPALELKVISDDDRK